jgi:DNA-binding NtrC family response regulator
MPPDVLITDWCVPGTISPRDLVRDVQRVSGNTRVVFMSGYSPEDLEENFAELPGVEYFAKPLNFDRFVVDIKAGRSSIPLHPQ